MVKFKTNSKLVQKHIAYTYDAIGTKLQKEVRDDTQGGFTGVDRTYYAGAFTYEKKIADTHQKLKFIAQPEGYIEPNVTSGISTTLNTGSVEMSYVYNFTDHLGNIRLSYSDKNNDGQITASTEIIEENNYYAFGLKHKGYNNVVNGTHYPYGYNGKEENDELGLEWLDFGARNYDASLGRWMNLDPLAELMRRHSPYNYAFDNPVYWIDPDGRSPEQPESLGKDGYGNTMTSGAFDAYDFSDKSPKKNRRTIINTFKYDKNANGNQIKTGTDYITETITMNRSSINENGESVYTETNVSTTMTVDSKGKISENATTEVKETITTMTEHGPKATFTSETGELKANHITPELREATNEVAEFKLDHEYGLSPVQVYANRVNTGLTGTVGIFTAGIGTAFSGSVTVAGYTFSETQIAIGGSIVSMGVEEATGFGKWISPEALCIMHMNEKF